MVVYVKLLLLAFQLPIRKFECKYRNFFDYTNVLLIYL